MGFRSVGDSQEQSISFDNVYSSHMAFSNHKPFDSLIDWTSLSPNAFSPQIKYRQRKPRIPPCRTSGLYPWHIDHGTCLSLGSHMLPSRPTSVPTAGPPNLALTQTCLAFINVVFMAVLRLRVKPCSYGIEFGSQYRAKLRSCSV